MNNEEIKKRNREYMRSYRKRTNNSHDKKYRDTHKEQTKQQYASWYSRNSEYEDARLARRMKWKGKYIFLEEKPLTKICSICKRRIWSKRLHSTKRFERI